MAHPPGSDASKFDVTCPRCGAANPPAYVACHCCRFPAAKKSARKTVADPAPRSAVKRAKKKATAAKTKKK